MTGLKLLSRPRILRVRQRYRQDDLPSNSQYIITLLTDSKSGTPHLHLDCNRVDMDNCLNSDHRIGIRAMMAAKEVNRMRGWRRTEDRFEENKARIKKDCLAVLSGMSAFSWEKYSAALEAKGYKVKLKMDASVTVRGYTIQSGNSVYKSSVIGRELTPSRIQETWEKMRPENRYGQMTPAERVAFALSEEGKNYLFPWGFTIDGKRYEKMVPGRVARVFAEESRLTEQSYSREETSSIFRTAFLLFAGYVDAATTFAQNCGGGGSAPDQNWGLDKNEDDILWARRCFRKAREMVTTPVIRWSRRR